MPVNIDISKDALYNHRISNAYITSPNNASYQPFVFIVLISVLLIDLEVYMEYHKNTTIREAEPNGRVWN